MKSPTAVDRVIGRRPGKRMEGKKGSIMVETFGNRHYKKAGGHLGGSRRSAKNCQILWGVKVLSLNTYWGGDGINRKGGHLRGLGRGVLKLSGGLFHERKAGAVIPRNSFLENTG